MAENQPGQKKQNRMNEATTWAGYDTRLREFICAVINPPPTNPTASQFNELALELFGLQFRHNSPYRRLCEARGMTPESISSWSEIPAVPTTAFKELDMTSLTPDERTTVFQSSGTTEQRRSRHFHHAASLALYEASLLPWFERHLLADVNDLVDEQLLGPLDKLPFLFLTPPPEVAPHSSLVHMFASVRHVFGAHDSLFAGKPDATGAWTLDLDAALFALRKSMCANRPLVLLGTAFNFVHLLDHFAANNMRYRLARGSRVLETGGYKGQSRIVPKAELHALISKHLGIPASHIVTEYGMSEISSQAYDRVAGEVHGQRSEVRGQRVEVAGHPQSSIFRFPAWARSVATSPETGQEVAEGETGLLRIFDLANVRSVMAIQTEDLAVRRGDAFELLGRAAEAEPRGCSLMSGGAQV